ncbi:MAG: hypothetical protein HY046_12740 [Acidobacteria bacterium]|nr:hypothetical protein [Acidobacteriota bacterium]
MNRPVGVSIIAVLLTFGSLFVGLMGVVMLLSESLAPPTTPPPPFAHAVAVIMAAVYFSCAGFGFFSAAGLYRMRPWARISILVISALLVVFCAFGLAMIFAMPMILPSTDEVQSVMPWITGILFVFFGVPMAFGVWWLIYFNRPRVKEVFLQGVVPDDRPRRPLSIVVIAWHAVVFGLTTLPLAAFQLPALIFGIILTGWSAQLVYFAFGSVELTIGIGLLKLKPWAHTAAVWFSWFLMAQATISVLLPNRAATMEEFLKYYPSEFRAQKFPFTDAFFWVGAFIAWATFGMALWYLSTRKKAYLEAGIFSSQNANR